jgi:7-carboxy-7-deazaguanine synthase
MEPQEVLDEIKKYYYKRVCITGGEPLLQKDIEKLLLLLADYDVTIETNGSMDISLIKLISKHSYVMDVKCPSSGVSEEMNFHNFEYLSERDEIKFVVGGKEDYKWAKGIIRDHYKKGTITFSPVFGNIEYCDLVDWILKDKLDVRFQIQLHKIIWGVEKRGV